MSTEEHAEIEEAIVASFKRLGQANYQELVEDTGLTIEEVRPAVLRLRYRLGGDYFSFANPKNEYRMSIRVEEENENAEWATLTRAIDCKTRIENTATVFEKEADLFTESGEPAVAALLLANAIGSRALGDSFQLWIDVERARLEGEEEQLDA